MVTVRPSGARTIDEILASARARLIRVTPRQALTRDDGLERVGEMLTPAPTCTVEVLVVPIASLRVTTSLTLGVEPAV